MAHLLAVFILFSLIQPPAWGVGFCWENIRKFSDRAHQLLTGVEGERPFVQSQVLKKILEAPEEARQALLASDRMPEPFQALALQDLRTLRSELDLDLVMRTLGQEKHLPGAYEEMLTFARQSVLELDQAIRGGSVTHLDWSELHVRAAMVMDMQVPAQRWRMRPWDRKFNVLRKMFGNEDGGWPQRTLSKHRALIINARQAGVLAVPATASVSPKEMNRALEAGVALMGVQRGHTRADADLQPPTGFLEHDMVHLGSLLPVVKQMGGIEPFMQFMKKANQWAGEDVDAQLLVFHFTHERAGSYGWNPASFRDFLEGIISVSKFGPQEEKKFAKYWNTLGIEGDSGAVWLEVTLFLKTTFAQNGRQVEVPELVGMAQGLLTKIDKN